MYLLNNVTKNAKHLAKKNKENIIGSRTCDENKTKFWSFTVNPGVVLEHQLLTG